MNSLCLNEQSLGPNIYSPCKLLSQHGQDIIADAAYCSGDSYSQTGFDPTLAAPSSSDPLGNPTFPGWTTTGGPNYLGYLIETYNTSLMLDWNFSSGGATVNASLVAPYASTVLSLIDQVARNVSHQCLLIPLPI
jgi:hypothetical protein